MTPEPVDHRPIPWWMALVVFFGIVLALLVFQVVIVSVTVATGSSPDLMNALVSPPGLAIQVAVMAILLVGVSVAVPRLFDVPPRRFLGLRPCRTGVYVASALGIVGVGFLVDEVTFVLHALSPATFDASGLALFNTIFVDASPMWFAVITLAVTLGPGIGEEIFFRGFALRSFRPHMPGWAAVILSAVLFGVIHFDRLQSPGAALIGLYLGFVALSTGSLWPAVLAHGLNNLICALFARFGGPEVSRVWDTGHPWWVLLAAALLTAGSMVALVRLSPRAPLSGGDNRPVP